MSISKGFSCSSAVRMCGGRQVMMPQRGGSDNTRTTVPGSTRLSTLPKAARNLSMPSSVPVTVRHTSSRWASKITRGAFGAPHRRIPIRFPIASVHVSSTNGRSRSCAAAVTCASRPSGRPAHTAAAWSLPAVPSKIPHGLFKFLAPLHEITEVVKRGAGRREHHHISRPAHRAAVWMAS